MNNCKGTAALLLGMAVLAAGCGRNMSISEIEAKERTSRLYTTAMEDLQAGRTDPAIRGFEQVLVPSRNYAKGNKAPDGAVAFNSIFDAVRIFGK